MSGVLDSTVPVVLEKGFKLCQSAGPVTAFEAWREGIVLENARTTDQAIQFKEMVKLLRNYRSYEVVEVKEIGRSSKILYVAMSFERGMLYGSFLVWRSERDWAVQRMDFSTKPEGIMPWLALGGGK